VIYPILDLKGIHSSVWPKGLTARCYVNLLEETTIKTLARFGVLGKRTDNPGVWVDDDTKIAALGVHLRRNVTSYGVGLNLSTELRWFDRIVACGLEGKKTTSMKAQGVDFEAGSDGTGDSMHMEVATTWAHEFTKGLWGDEGTVDRVQDVEKTEEHILGK
jgi:lipoyl(octanoyl) transferase